MRYLGLVILALSLPYLTDVAADWSIKRAQRDAAQVSQPYDIEGLNRLLADFDREKAHKESRKMTQEERNRAVAYLWDEK